MDFEKKDSIHKLLGFSNKKLKAHVIHLSDQPINIIKVNTIRIECNIIEGAFVNGQKAYTIHEFSPAVPASYKIAELPKKVIIYLLKPRVLILFNYTLLIRTVIWLTSEVKILR